MADPTVGGLSTLTLLEAITRGLRSALEPRAPHASVARSVAHALGVPASRECAAYSVEDITSGTAKVLPTVRGEQAATSGSVTSRDIMAAHMAWRRPVQRRPDPIVHVHFGRRPVQAIVAQPIAGTTTMAVATRGLAAAAG